MINRILQVIGYKISKTNKYIHDIPNDFEAVHSEIYNKVRPYTMTSPQRVYTLIEAVNYIERNNIEGDIVECGVWKGGSMMAAALTLNKNNSHNRQLYLYDTYEGMSAPTEKDVTFSGDNASDLLQNNSDKESNLVWAYSPIDEVKKNVYSTEYPKEKIHFIKGKVEATIPQTLPSKISILRLDTDWYESTLHELNHLFPLLSQHGVLIIDDYGHWEGARKAVDEYFEQQNFAPYLSRIDETGRVLIKQ